MTEETRLTLAHATPMEVEQFGESPVLEFADEPPDFHSLEEGAEWYEAQAKTLADFLGRVLPGGTYDRLCARMLVNKASHLRGPFPRSD